ncbi:TIGR03503 family protein [Photobacterium sp. S4TG1]|uniref:TIGR03503 family protein n=1 Tax=Photobacterium sp. S4TG1 TaxID=3114587 RepID=UPI002E19F620|nr:TIGR03503 family protein [Photobacterium sp. S4TG1]
MTLFGVFRGSMLRRLWLLIFYVTLCTWISISSAWAQTEARLTWLDNRFRVDPEIEQITFVVTRDQPSQSVILVAPDGRKYYADRHAKTMSWYTDKGMDIISITHPMAGPWQALGKVSANNGIRFISNIQLQAEPLPAQLYQTEVLKFSAQLTQNKQPLLLRDFLDRVQLKVVFYPLTSVLPEQSNESAPTVVGQFADDGRQYDEVAGDGIFTVALNVNVEPGKYRVEIASSNGVFKRAIEQTVLIYPAPITTSFVQSHQLLTSHIVNIDAKTDQTLAGSLAAYLVVKQPQKKPIIIQQSTGLQQSHLALSWANDAQIGKAWWRGWVYVTDSLTQRELVFRLSQHNYTQVAAASVDLSASLAQQQAKKQLIVHNEQQQQQQQQRLLWVVVTNIVIVISAMVVLLIWRRKRTIHSDLIVPK